MKNVSVIGQGYVGLPLAIAAAKSGYEVVGIDNNESKVNLLNSGLSTIEDVPNSEIENLLKTGRYRASVDFSVIKNSDVILICVPTPLSDLGGPDLKPLKLAIENISKFIKRKTLIILESTVEPGTTRNYLVPLLEEKSVLLRTDFEIAFSPERIDPTNIHWNIRNTPKVVSGLTDNSRELAVNFYSKFIDKIIVCGSLEIAETAKLLENSFRFINISFINEFLVFCNKLNIDIMEVINVASTKPYGFMPFYPSIGIGGHCIPIDPLYLANKALEVGAPTKFIDLASKVNNEMPKYFASKAELNLGTLRNKKILVIGVAYKIDISDTRESPSAKLIFELRLSGAYVDWHDEIVKDWNGEKSSIIREGYDLAIVATEHSYLDLTRLGTTPILRLNGVIT